MKANYHTHTTRCQHAAGTDEEYVKSAIRAGFDELGFSDHCPWKYDSAFVAHMRMPLSEFNDYASSIRHLKDKYKDQISIKLGLECEYFERYMPWMKQFILDQGIDYIIFGNHYDQSDELGIYFGSSCKDEKGLKRYVDEAIAGMETGWYSYLAHPDLFMRCYPSFDESAARQSRRLCEAAKRLHIPLEYNLAGVLYNERFHADGYPHRGFWNIVAETGNEAIIGVDAHDNRHLEDDRHWKLAEQVLSDLGITVLDHIEMKDFSKM